MEGGCIPQAIHVPRGMLEFWIAPDSDYHKVIFASGKKFIFFCALGHRSALATLAAQNMGLSPVAHIQGGYTAWGEIWSTYQNERTQVAIFFYINNLNFNQISHYHYAQYISYACGPPQFPHRARTSSIQLKNEM